MTVNNSYLTGLFSSSSTSTSLLGGSSSASTVTTPTVNLGSMLAAIYPTTSSSSSSTTTSKPTSPTAPWSTSQPTQSALVQQALNGQPFINPTAAKLDVTNSNSSVNQDYKDLFSLYQGLNTLYAITQQAGASGNSSLQTTQLNNAFNAGMSQVASFLQGSNFKNVTLVQGNVASSQASSVGVSQGGQTYVGQNIVQGSSATPQSIFDGPFQFSMNVTGDGGAQTTVNFDLSQMGSTPRTLTNVLTYLNDLLAAAGVKTRFATQRTAGQPQTVQVGSNTVNLSAGPDQYALTIVGSPNESVSLSAPDTADAVYVAQGSGSDGSAGQQLLKFQTDTAETGSPQASQTLPGATHVTAGETWQDNLPSTVTGVQATAAGPDGSVYVLANINGTTSGQPIQGSGDVALMKYDSAGNLVFTQTLGANQTASGLGMAVSADGEVAITGQVTGSLNPGDGLTSDAQSAFVTVYDPNGDQLWSQTVPAASGSQGNAVAFGADDSVYLVGQASSAIFGAGGSKGGSDSFLAGFSATGKQQFVTQFGTTGADKATAVTVDGNQVLVGGTENGSGVVRSYQVGSSGAPTLTAQQNLGSLGGGSIAGLAVGSNGQLLVAGTSYNTNLNAGVTTAAGGTGANAFVATLDPTLQTTSNDRIAYYQNQGGTTVTAVSVSNGQVYIAGETGPTITVPGSELTSDGKAQTPQTGQAGYLAQINPITGQVGFTTALSGDSGIAAPTSIAVSSGGASVLDKLGLPSGTISQTGNSNLLTTATSVQAGDSFYIQAIAGQSPIKITIQADDTWKTLAARIQQASAFRLTASVKTTVTSQTLSLTAASPGVSVQLLPGPAGQNALAALGLTSGVVQSTPSSSSSSGSSSSSSSSTQTTFGLNLASTLDLSSTTDIKHAAAQLQAAMSTVKNAYQALVAKNSPQSSQNTSSTKPVPAYLQAQISNYAAGLARLTGS